MNCGFKMPIIGPLLLRRDRVNLILRRIFPNILNYYENDLR